MCFELVVKEDQNKNTGMDRVGRYDDGIQAQDTNRDLARIRAGNRERKERKKKEFQYKQQSASIQDKNDYETKKNKKSTK